MSSVYWIHHKDHTDMFSQGYIGVSNNFKRRLVEHKTRTQNAYLKNAINKYGWDNLIKQQILIADMDYCLEIESKLRPNEKMGWNLVVGGGKPPIAYGNKSRIGKTPWNKGLKMSDETKAKVIMAAKAQWQKLGMRELLSNAKKGKPSPMSGKKHSPETIEKMSLIKLGKKPSKETIQKMSIAAKNKKAPILECLHCNKIGGIGAMKRWHFNNCKNKGIK